MSQVKDISEKAAKSREKFLDRLMDIAADPHKVVPLEQPEGKKREATEEEYYALFRDYYGVMWHDMFSGELLYRNNESGYWAPANQPKLINVLKTRAWELERCGVVKYPAPKLEAYLDRFNDSKSPVFIPFAAMPKWDGRDRIEEIADAVTIKASQGLTMNDLGELLKEWLVKAIIRTASPQEANTLLVLKGPQGIGKDYLIQVLCGWAGQWFAPATILRDEKDSQLQIVDNLILHIAEFDRAAKWEAGFLKDLIDRPLTKVRRPYDRAPEPRPARASFIASCNVDDVLRDHTGARRYLLFDVERIKWGYPDSPEDSLQILAQVQQLAEHGYRASQGAKARMAGYLNLHLPDDPDDSIVDSWVHHLGERLKLYDGAIIARRGFITNEEAQVTVEIVAKATGSKARDVQALLKRRGIKGRFGFEKYRGYRLVSDM